MVHSLIVLAGEIGEVFL